MSARIARGGGGRSKPKPRTSVRGGSRKAPPPGMLESLPLPADTIRRVSGWLLGIMLLALALAVIVAFGLPQMAGMVIGEAIGRAGFTVRHIEPKGLNHLNPMQVYHVAENQLDRAMLLVDLEGTRANLLRFGWVKDARVSRRFPDTVVVDIVERSPAAIWQYNQKLNLIDAEGVVLEEVRLEAMPDLPLVIGPAANRHVPELNRLLATTPQLKPIMASATWIGGRRWDINFHSGETLALPEGESGARKALARFSEMDRKTQLLGRGLARFDMRIPGKLIVRVSREPGTIVPPVQEPAPAPVPAPIPAPAPIPGAGEPNTAQTI